jgi:hypothetical protein
MTQPVHVVSQRSATGLQTCPAAQVVPPGWQRLAVSSHVSVPLHETESLQKSDAEPAQTPAAQVSFVVQKAPSSQEAPSFGLKAVREVATLQTWQGLAGLGCPAP